MNFTTNNTSTKPIIIAVDHGYGNIKTAHTIFKTGVTAYDKEPTFKSNMLVYQGRYYIIGDENKEFTAEKMNDQDYYILTLAAIGIELRLRGLTSARVNLAAGLPLTWVGEQKEAFKAYLLQNKEADFSFRGESYHVEFVGADVFPQGFSAVADRLREFKGVNMLCDIGNGTMNIMYINNGKPIASKCFTEKFGTHQCMLAAREKLMQRFGVAVDDAVIVEVLRYTFLVNDSQTVFVEADECVEALDGVSAAGVVDPGVWDTADPMGFDTYAPFIANNGSGSAVIAVIDSGVAKNASYIAKLRSDGINMLKAQDGQEWYNDLNRHGSVIASVIGDCVGNANVSILPIRVVGASGTTDFILLGNAIKYAVAHGASIINLSMNFKQSDYVTFCIQQAIAAGVTVVVAAGNAGRNISNVYPANVSGVVTVSGLGKNYQLSASSNYGAGISYCAPDSYVKTSAYSNSLFNGTSFAAPMIASGLALLSLDPYHTINDFNNSCYLSNDTDSPVNSYGNGMPRLDRLADIPVRSIAFGSSLPSKLAVGESVELSWEFDPTNATNKQVTVTSNNENVLSVAVDNSGTVTMTAAGTGNATLTAASASTGVSVSREFTVVRPVSGITISGGKERLSLSRTLQLSAIVSPSNATTKTIEWKSTDETIATVSQSGLVTPKKTGKVGIYAKATDGYGVESEKLWINIVPIPDAESIELYINETLVNDTEIPMIPGSTLQIVASVKPEDADQDVKYRALGNYVTVSKTGLVTAVSPGIAYIDVTSEDGNASASVRIKVVVLPTSVMISGNTIVNEGKSINLTATVLPEDAEDRTVRWRSGNEKVATVDRNGKVTGVKAGTAIIYATANGDSSVETTATITVRHPYTLVFDANTPESVLTPSISFTSKNAISGVKIGALPTASCDKYDFMGWFTAPSDGEKMSESSIINTAEASVSLYAHWFPVYVTGITIVTNPTVTSYIAGDMFSATGLTIQATYNNGTVETHDVSDCTISSPDMTSAGIKQVTVSFGGKSTTFDITVNALMISLSADTSTGTSGYIQLSASVSRGYVSWASNNGGVATVDSGGKVTFKKTVGTAIITATVNNNGVTSSASKSITISNSQGTKFGETSSSTTDTVLYGTHPNGYSTSLRVTIGSIPSYTTNYADVSNSSTSTSTGRIDMTYANNGVDGYVYYQFNYNSSSGRDNENKIINYQEGWRKTPDSEGNIKNFYYYNDPYGRQFYSSTDYSEHTASAGWTQYYARWWAYQDKQEGHTWYVATGIDGALAASWYRFPLTKYKRTTTTYTYYCFTVS